MNGSRVCDHSAILRLGMEVALPIFVSRRDRFSHLHRRRELFLRDGIFCLPCEEFLLALRPGKEISP